jgi:hypothetical protein
MSSKKNQRVQSSRSQLPSQSRSQERPDSAAPKLMYTVAERAQKAGLGKLILSLRYTKKKKKQYTPL